MDTSVLKSADEPPSPRRRRQLVIGVGVAAALAIGIGVGYALQPTSRTAAPASSTPASSSSRAPASDSAEPPGPPAAESGDPRSGPLDVDLSPGQGVGVRDDGTWTGHGSLAGVVTVTNPGDSTSVNPLEVVLTVPTEGLHLNNRDDDRWDCEVEDYGMRCTIPDAVEPRESWPELLVGFVEDTTVAGTFTATTSGPGIGEASVEFTIDTSL